MKINQSGQAMPDMTRHMQAGDFARDEQTALYWLGNAGFMIHSHDMNVMVDPLLEGFDMPLLIDMPIVPQEIESLDAVLITHIDNDHFSRQTCLDMKGICQEYHAPAYVAEVMREEGLNGHGHAINESFMIRDMKITLTPALHNWQNGSSKWHYREWKKDDYCGFYIEVDSKKIWTPGDSQLLEEQLHYDQPDVILFDFSDNEWHITFEGALKLAKAYPKAKLICIHWGSVNAPYWSTFNGNPEELKKYVLNPERVIVLNPGEKYVIE